MKLQREHLDEKGKDLFGFGKQFSFLAFNYKISILFFVFSVFCENNFLLLLLFFVYRSLKIENKVKTRCYFCN